MNLLRSGLYEAIIAYASLTGTNEEIAEMIHKNIVDEGIEVDLFCFEK